jgi:hypothetical protein
MTLGFLGPSGFSRGLKVDFGWDIEYLLKNIDITGA